MSDTRHNKFREALEVLQRGRDLMVDNLADEILTQGEDFPEGGFSFNEFLEIQGTRIHFLSLLMAQLEQSAEALDEAVAPPPPPTPRRRRSRAKKLERHASSAEGSPGEQD